MGVIELGPEGSLPVGTSPSIELPQEPQSTGELIKVEDGIQVNDPIDIPDAIPADGVILLDSLVYPKDATYKYLIELLDVTKIRGDWHLLVFDAQTGYYNHKDVNDLPIIFPVDSVFGRTGDILALAGDYTALKITYDNSSSSLAAVNVQAAIDELDAYVIAIPIINDTDDVPEGAVNLYWTQARFDTAFGLKTTTDLTEGVNLYYTEARVSANASVVLNTAKVSADGSVNTHSDVDTLTSPPSINDFLAWTGLNWSPFTASGGVPPYTNVTPMPEQVGGYEIGTTFALQNYYQMWDGLLYPYQYPAFSSFTMSGYSSILECGIYITGGVHTFTWGTSNPSNITSNSIDIIDQTTTTILATGLADDGTENVDIGSAITETLHNTPHVWRIDALNSKAETFSRTLTTRWYSPTYWGSGAPGLTVTQIQELSGKALYAKAERTISYSPVVQVFYYAYPSSFGPLTSILDANGFETIGDWTLRLESFTNHSPYYEGVATNYNVYEFNNLTTQTNFNNTFKF